MYLQKKYSYNTHSYIKNHYITTKEREIKLKTKKLMLILLATILATTSLAGCSNSESGSDEGNSTDAGTNTGENDSSDDNSEPGVVAEPGNPQLPLTDEKVTFSVYMPWSADYSQIMTDWSDNTLWQEMEIRTNVALEFTSPPVGQETEKFNLLVSSGDYPDLIMRATTDQYKGGPDKAIADGNYIRINEYLDEFAPNYKEAINLTDDSRKQSYTDDGNIWGFHFYDYNLDTMEVQGGFVGMTIRQDFLDEWSLETPVTYDDWHEVLTNFKDNGVEIPLFLPKTGIATDEALNAGYDVGTAFYQVDDVVKYGPIEPGYKEYITTLAQWYEEGLIDPDFASRDTAQLENLIVTDQVGALCTGFWNYDPWQAKATNEDFRMVGVTAPVVNEGDVANLRQANFALRPSGTTVITKNCTNPELAVRFIDYLYSPDGTILANYGREGEGLYYDENGDPQLTDLINNNPDGFVSNLTLATYAMHTGPCIRDYTLALDAFGQDALDTEEIWSRSTMDWVMPPITNTAEEGDEIAMLMSDIDTLVAEKSARFIMGVDSLEDYDAFVEQINSMGIDRVLELKQAALDRYNAR